MKSEVVECVCGREVILSKLRVTPKESVICPSCFRNLVWIDGEPTAQGSSGKRVKLKLIGVTEI